MPTLFKSATGKQAILAVYDQKLASLNIDYTSQYVDTSFGQIHLLVTGSPVNPPLVLVHGSNGCAPVALACYPNLSQQYRVFAVDVPGQPNRSAETRLSMQDDSYSRWLNEVIDQLNITDVTLAGFSFGGLVILKTLAYDATKIKSAFLASPAYLVNGNPLKALFKIFLPMQLYMRTQRLKYLEKFLAVVFTERDSFAVEFLAKVFLHFDMDFTPVPVISEEEAKRITTPLTILAAKEDVLFPGVKMLKRAEQLISSLRETVLLEESKHVQNAAGNAVFENLIVKQNS